MTCVRVVRKRYKDCPPSVCKISVCHTQNFSLRCHLLDVYFLGEKQTDAAAAVLQSNVSVTVAFRFTLPGNLVLAPL